MPQAQLKLVKRCACQRMHKPKPYLGVVHNWLKWLKPLKPTTAHLIYGYSLLMKRQVGPKATGSVQITGTATQAGTFSLMIAGNNYKTAVTSGDTADVVAGKLQN